MAANDRSEKVFHHFLDLLPELRMMVVDEMYYFERCIFTRCSKLCQKEAKASKKYIYGITFSANSDENLMIDVRFDDSRRNVFTSFYEGDLPNGFMLIFEKDTYSFSFEEQQGWQYFRVFRDTRYQEMFYMDIEVSIDLVQYAVQHFKNILKCYQNTIRYLQIDGELFEDELKNCEFEVESMNKLETVCVPDDLDVLQFVTKTKLSLREARGRGTKANNLPVKPEQIFQVSNSLCLIDLKLNYEEFSRFSAPYVLIHIGQLTVQDIFNFITSWQNGTAGIYVKGYGWDLDDSNFDKLQLFSLFDVTPDDNLQLKVTIKNHKDATKSAELEVCYQNCLRFDTNLR